MSRVDNRELEQEYIDLIKNNKKKFKQFLCASCITKTLFVEPPPKGRSIIESIEKTEHVESPRICPYCGNYMFDFYMVDLSGVYAMESGVGIN
jgi:hypothetical protein